MSIGKIIQAKRKELGFSRQEIAKLVGITEDYYKKIELDLRKPNINLLAWISVVLEIPLQKLILYLDDEK